jgi:hypothetical protein
MAKARGITQDLVIARPVPHTFHDLAALSAPPSAPLNHPCLRERDIITPVRILLELCRAAIDRASAILVVQKNAGSRRWISSAI